MPPETIVITGGAGRIATALRPRLRKSGRTIRLLDVTAPEGPLDVNEEFHHIPVTDLDGTTRACLGARALVHLGGDPSERPWAELVDTNITGTYTAFESARAAGVPNVFFASSLHCVGYNTFESASQSPVAPPRPDTLYGVTKAAGEAIGSLYADRFSMRVVAARIMEFGEHPSGQRQRLTWFSHDDAARLVEAAIQLAEPGFHIVWGSSRNSKGTVPLGPGEAIGFFPQDDAEDHLQSMASSPKDDPKDPKTELIAGTFIDPQHPINTDWT
ncbi:NAD(P)-dependent oxidoreductase [Paenarthrobacter sp. OM7]|uniref:NAD-dependent epimerase/dehydratase family protein n=1 Tax=Paenarthrobacter sp. OM7 TaxID=3041264 RepID=UPI002469316A|nr:NAD(P)-dependent oxidoreductase [Paenarthrobacter sp. OM7]WGM20274.1 NAD(P)-dependent oxidoreductase [Paenarthrobacter sp. OM7]